MFVYIYIYNTHQFILDFQKLHRQETQNSVGKGTGGACGQDMNMLEMDHPDRTPALKRLTVRTPQCGYSVWGKTSNTAAQKFHIKKEHIGTTK